MTVATLVRDQLSRDPAEHAINFKGNWYTRGWISERVKKLNAALDALGVPANAPIGFAPHNRPEFAAALIALFASERPIVMLYAYQSTEALATKMRELRLPVVIASREQWVEATLDAAGDVGSAAISIELGDLGVETLLPWAPRAGLEQRALTGSAGMDLLTSGTTGAPKHFNISYEKLHGRMVVNTAFGASELAPLMLFFPMSNISGIYLLMPAFAAGQRVELKEKFTIADWVEFVKTYRVKTMGVPPAAFRMALDAEVDPADLASLENLNTGAATLDPSLRREFEARYGIPILQSYGATEFGGVVSIVLPDHRKTFGEAKADSVGRPCPGVRMRVTEPDTGAELAANQEGRLEVFAPGMSEDWIRTTDLAVIDDDGFVYHRGRLDGAIMRGGFKIVPEQIAETLASHPSIAAAVAVGIPDPRLGSVPAALIQLREDTPQPTRAELDAYLRARLPAPSIPSRYGIAPSFPRTPSLKVDLTAVRALFATDTPSPGFLQILD